MTPIRREFNITQQSRGSVKLSWDNTKLLEGLPHSNILTKASQISFI
ncbi:hypothetical protein D037_4951 [Vibrio parahaemolyticus IDH02640]|nr:hypothetical protein D037_4951 [Vibrio parahaemolyticus IDH02640]